MRCRCEESCLCVIGTVGGKLGLRQFGVQLRQFARPLSHAYFERLVGLLQSLLRAPIRRHVRVAGHEAASRHRVAENLENDAVRQLALVRVGFACAHVRQSALDGRVDVLGANPAARGVVADEVFDVTADGDHARWIVEQLLVALIPCDQAEIGVDDAHALRQVLEGRAQQFAIELDRVRGFVEKAHHVFRLHVAPTQGRAQHQARAGRAQHACQQMLNVACKIGTGVIVVVNVGVSCARRDTRRTPNAPVPVR